MEVLSEAISTYMFPSEVAFCQLGGQHYVLFPFGLNV
jgi:hypothetical protein